MRISSVLGAYVFAAACAAAGAKAPDQSIHPPGGPVPADFSLCDLSPAPSACDIPYSELTAETARKRLDAEYARLKKVAPAAAREFAIHSFSAAKLSTASPHYASLRNRAWRAAFEAPEKDGARYVLLREIGNAADTAGDRDMARDTIRQRRLLIRRRRDDQEWKEWKGGDVSIGWSRNETWRQTAFDAARFGDPDLAIAVLDEAVPVSERESFDYLSDLAAIRLEAGQYEQAEALARRIIEMAPYRFREMREMYEDEKIVGYRLLIESLFKQEKKVDHLTDKLFSLSTDLPASLNTHARNLFGLAHDFADYAPQETARRFLEAGQQIYRIDGGSADFVSRIPEIEACKALRDDACLLEIARANEKKVGPQSSPYFWAVAMPYAVAGDFASVKRLFRSVKPERCDPLIYPAIAERLKRDNELTAISGWLREWVVCQLSHKPNFQHWTGLTGNFWARIAESYAAYSMWQSEAGSHRAALNSARMSLLLAVETETTWRSESEYYRAQNFARAYGSALGALVRAEAAVSAAH